MKKRLFPVLMLLLAFVFSACDKDNPEIQLVEKVLLNPDKIEIVKGTAMQLEMEIYPEGAVYNEVEWTSSDENIAVVDTTGNVSAIALGKATITLMVDDFVATCLVTVVEAPVSEIIMDMETVTMNHHEQIAISATVLPADVQNAKFDYKIGDPSVLEMYEDLFFYEGKCYAYIQGMKPGNTTLTISSGDVSATCNVQVNAIPVESFSLYFSELEMTLNEKYQMKTIIEPENATAQDVVWSSSDESVVSVDDSGIFEALKCGQARITATLDGKTATCDVTVSEDRNARFGDYYYSDGTTSSELLAEKTPIGIVFYTGNPAEHDEVLKREHPECTHGLVVSLHDLGYSAWQANFGNYKNTVGAWIEQNAQDYVSITSGEGEETMGYFNEELGYNNTKAIELFNEANPEFKVDAVEMIVDYRNTVKAPEGSSDWYMPSIKELALLSWGEIEGNLEDAGVKHPNIAKDLDEKLKEIEGASNIYRSAIWSSTERNSDYAYLFYYDYGLIASYPDKAANDRFTVRAILAF